VAHLDELQAKYGDRGLVVLAVTDEDAAKVGKFIADTGAKHAVVIESGNITIGFGVTGFPSSFLVDPDGNIAWFDHFSSKLPEAVIEENLRKVRLTPDLPKSLASAAKSIEKGDYAGARKFLSGKIDSGSLDRADATVAEETVKWIDGRAVDLEARAKKSGEAGDWYDASLALERLADEYKGLEAGEKAAADLREIEKDKDKKPEIDAGRTLEKTMERARKMKPEQAAALYRALARKYEGTKAGRKAAELATREEAKSK